MPGRRYQGTDVQLGTRAVADPGQPRRCRCVGDRPFAINRRRSTSATAQLELTAAAARARTVSAGAVLSPGFVAKGAYGVLRDCARS